MGTTQCSHSETGRIMEDGLELRLKLEEIKSLYRIAKGQFLFLHRIMVRHGLVSDKERMMIYDLTNKHN